MTEVDRKTYRPYNEGNGSNALMLVNYIVAECVKSPFSSLWMLLRALSRPIIRWGEFGVNYVFIIWKWVRVWSTVGLICFASLKGIIKSLYTRRTIITPHAEKETIILIGINRSNERNKSLPRMNFALELQLNDSTRRWSLKSLTASPLPHIEWYCYYKFNSGHF